MAIRLNDQMIIGLALPIRRSTAAQIIGVVGDVRDRALNRDPLPNVYLLRRLAADDAATRGPG